LQGRKQVVGTCLSASEFRRRVELGRFWLLQVKMESGLVYHVTPSVVYVSKAETAAVVVISSRREVVVYHTSNLKCARRRLAYAPPNNRLRVPISGPNKSRH